MILADLISQFRTDANDKAQPYFWSDAEVVAWLNEAETEAAIRGRLIHESADSAVCEIAIAAGQSVEQLHPAIYELSHISFKDVDGKGDPSLCITSTGELDKRDPEWRSKEGDPTDVIQNDKSIRLVPRPIKAGVVTLEGYRLPMEPMELADADSVEPEINAAHHRHLIKWVLHRAFSIPDTEAFDPNRSAEARIEFERYFGLRPDSDLRRITREDVPHTVKAHWV